MRKDIGLTEEEENQLSSITDGYCIAYFQHEVLVGRWDGQKTNFYHDPVWSKLQEAHFFNENCEFRVIKTSTGFKRRWKKDEQDENDSWFDEHMLIIGSQNPQKLNDKFIRLEERGRSIVLPSVDMGESAVMGQSVVIRNYIAYDEQLDFEAYKSGEEKLPVSEIMRVTDWRYVGFVNEEVR